MQHIVLHNRQKIFMVYQIFHTCQKLGVGIWYHTAFCYIFWDFWVNMKWSQHATENSKISRTVTRFCYTFQNLTVRNAVLYQNRFVEKYFPSFNTQMKCHNFVVLNLFFHNTNDPKTVTSKMTEIFFHNLIPSRNIK